MCLNNSNNSIQSIPSKDRPVFLSAEDVRRTLPMPDAIDAMREAFKQLEEGEVQLPPRQHIDVKDENGCALVMACHSSALKLFSLKFITLFGNNREHGLPMIQALIILADGITGEHLAVLDGSSITALRTGAVSGLATDLLSNPDAAAAAVFGAGVQGRTQLEAVCCVRPIERAFVVDLYPEAAERFAEEMSRELGIPVTAATAEEAVRNADVICTVTTAPEPVFEDSWLKPGAHVNAVGVYKPELAEIPAQTVCRARVVVDHLESALEEAGDLLRPMRAGLIEQSHFETELGAVLQNKAEGRRNPEEITLFKSVGVAIQDLCAAARAIENFKLLESP